MLCVGSALSAGVKRLRYDGDRFSGNQTDYPLGQIHPSDITQESADKHQPPDFPERCPADAEGHHQGIAQERKKGDGGQPYPFTVQKALGLFYLASFDAQIFFNPLHLAESADEIICACPAPIP